jgi:hypothetical protein
LLKVFFFGPFFPLFFPAKQVIGQNMTTLTIRVQ